MNKPNYYESKAKQAFLFGNSSAAGAVLITILFLVNMGLILAADCFLIHTIPCDETDRPLLEERFQVLDMERMSGSWLVLYQGDAGETLVGTASRNLLGRYRFQEEITTVTEDPCIYDTLRLDFTIENGHITKAGNLPLITNKMETGLLLALGFLVTALERMLFQKLRGE